MIINKKSIAKILSNYKLGDIIHVKIIKYVIFLSSDLINLKNVIFLISSINMNIKKKEVTHRKS